MEANKRKAMNALKNFHRNDPCERFRSRLLVPIELALRAAAAVEVMSALFDWSLGCRHFMIS